MFAVRKANISDTEVLAEMLCDSYQLIFPDYADTNLDSYLEVTPKFIKDMVNDLFVVVDNTVVKGYMLGSLTTGVGITKAIYTVHQIYVPEEDRNTRAAYTLIKYAEDLAKKHNSLLNVVVSANEVVTSILSKYNHRIESTVIRIDL